MRSWKKTVIKTYSVSEPKPVFGDSLSVANIARAMLAGEEFTQDQEHLWVFGLDTKNSLKMVQLVGLGGLAAALADIRVIFRALILHACTGFVLVHNHPSGDPSVSKEDSALTDRIAKGAKLLDYRFLDSVIVGANSHFSFADAGMI